MTEQANTQPPLPSAPSEQPKPARAYFLRDTAPDLFFTGEGLKQADPQIYQAALELLADATLSQRQIAAALKISPNTLRAIARAEAPGIDATRAGLAIHCQELEGATLDRIAEILDRPSNKLDLRELAATLREIGNRADVLAGRPSGIIEHRHDIGPAALAEAAAARRAKLSSIITTCDERTSGIHSMDEKSELHEAEPARPIPAGATVAGLEHAAEAHQVQPDPDQARADEPAILHRINEGTSHDD